MSTPKQPEWHTEHVIRSYDVDPQMNARLPSLCRFMQEAAYHHAEHLELGQSFLSEQGLAWVLCRQRIEVEKLPEWGDSVRLRTWPSGRDRLFFYRDFEITDEAGKRLLLASTAWFIIDLDKREHVHPEWLSDVCYPVGKKVFEARLGRLKGCACETGEIVPVSYGDLDMNGHVNNIRYIEWILNGLPLKFHQEHALKSLEVNYLSEAVYGHSVAVCEREIEPLIFSHGVMADSTDLFRASSVWKLNL